MKRRIYSEIRKYICIKIAKRILKYISKKVSYVIARVGKFKKNRKMGIVKRNKSKREETAKCNRGKRVMTIRCNRSRRIEIYRLFRVGSIIHYNQN